MNRPFPVTVDTVQAEPIDTPKKENKEETKEEKEKEE